MTTEAEQFPLVLKGLTCELKRTRARDIMDALKRFLADPKRRGEKIPYLEEWVTWDTSFDMPIEDQLTRVFFMYSTTKFNVPDMTKSVTKHKQDIDLSQAIKDTFEELEKDAQVAVMRLARILCVILYYYPKANPLKFLPYENSPVMVYAMATLCLLTKDGRYYEPFMTIEEMQKNIYTEIDADLNISLSQAYYYSLERQDIPDIPKIMSKLLMKRYFMSILTKQEELAKLKAEEEEAAKRKEKERKKVGKKISATDLLRFFRISPIPHPRRIPLAIAAQ